VGRSLFAAIAMVSVSIALSWLPVLGLAGFIAGLVGGCIIGTGRRALRQAILPLVVLLILLVVVGLGGGVLVGHAVIGSVVAGLVALWFAIHSVTLFLGAWAGGTAKERWDAHRRQVHLERRQL